MPRSNDEAGAVLWAFILDLYLKADTVPGRNELRVIQAHIEDVLDANPHMRITGVWEPTWLRSSNAKATAPQTEKADNEVDMVTPHTCPTCCGAGRVSRPPWLAGDIYQWGSADTTLSTFPCRSCIGTGIVWEWTEQDMASKLKTEKADRPGKER